MINCSITVTVIEDENGLSFQTTRKGNGVPKPIYLMALEYAKFQVMDLVDNEVD